MQAEKALARATPGVRVDGVPEQGSTSAAGIAGKWWAARR